MKRKVDALGYYGILDVPFDADISFIKRNYYERAKTLHPDVNEAGNAVDIFQKLSVAYNVLSNPFQRVQYDLLSLVYNEDDFPQLGSLKIYKNQANEDDTALRVLKQKRVKTSVTNSTVYESKDICNIHEACNMVLNTSLHNWLYGWWGKGAVSKNLSAIKFNLRSTAVDDEDNLKLLLHNAVAYAQEKNIEMAWIYAQQVKVLWGDDDYIRELIDKFINCLNYQPSRQVVIPYWNAKELKYRQLLFPLFLGLCLLMLICGCLYYNGILGNTKKYDYYQGGGVGADMIESKIIKTDSDESSREYLAHFNQDTVIYYGPDERYEVMKQMHQNQTVRITGYTVNKEWYQIVIDNGERGYVQKDKINKGMGDEVPFNSHVYRK